VWFVVLYSALSVACALHPPDPTLGAITRVNGALSLLTLLTTGFLLYWAKQCLNTLGFPATKSTADTRKPPRRFIVWVAIHAYVSAAVATFSIGLLVVFLPPCS
jgi:hypothetical protein